MKGTKGLIVLVLLISLLTGCTASQEESSDSYQSISAEEAKAILDTQSETVILDVRELDEYEQEHIPGAVLLPVETIAKDTASRFIPDQKTPVLVYCRSGNRSKTASSILAELGYTQVYNFGGIQDWPFETEP